MYPSYSSSLIFGKLLILTTSLLLTSYQGFAANTVATNDKATALNLLK